MSRLQKLACAGTALCALFAVPALAADVPAMAYKGTVSATAPVSPLYVRAGGLLGLLNPTFSSGAPAAGAGLSASTVGTLGFDVGYFLTENIAVSIGAGVPPSVTTYGQGAISGLGALGSSVIAPAMLTAHYHFTGFGGFQPYIGGGVVWNIVLANGSLALPNYALQSNVGGVLQAGVDYYFNSHWGLFVDAKKLFLTTGVTSSLPLNAQVNLDPWIFTTGVVYRF